MTVLDIAARGLRFDAFVDGPADGPLVLLLHGFPQSAWEWHHQLPALAAAGYRAVAPQQRGYSPGARPDGVDAYVLDELVADVVGIADALGADRFHLVGHDWGGFVAWHFAAAHADRLQSVTTVSVPHPNAYARALDPASGSDQHVRAAYVEDHRLPGPEHADKFIADGAAFLRMAYEHTGLAGHDVEPHVTVLSDPGAMDAALNWYRANDFHEFAVADIEVPTLFVWGTDDIAISREGAEWTADHVRGPYRFEVIERGSHWIPEAAAERFTEMLLNHLSANS